MKPDRIEQLLRLLPLEAPYLMRIPRELSLRGLPDEVDLYAYAVNDPAFGVRFIRSFVELRRSLPVTVYESQLLRAYCYLWYRNGDQDVRAAFDLRRQRDSARCILLECLLLRREWTEGAIAKKLSLTEAAIRIYGTLFWNVRDRLDDRIYLNTLVFPESRQVELVPGYDRKERPRNLALRLAVGCGPEAAEEYLGILQEGTGSSRTEPAEAFAARVLSTGNFLAKMGFLHQNLEAVKTAVKVVQLQRRQRVQPMARSANAAEAPLGIARAVAMTLDRIIGRQKAAPTPRSASSADRNQVAAAENALEST